MADLKKHTKKWFKKHFDDSGEGDEEFLIRYMPDHVFDSIKKDCTVINMDGKNPKDEIDVDRFNFVLFDWALMDWKGFEVDGEPAKCDEENKRLLLEHRPDRAFFVMEVSRNPQAFYGDYQELKKKSEALLNMLLDGLKTKPASTAASA